MSPDFIESHGNAFFAHRLRRSSELIVEQVGADLARHHLDVPPRGASMLLVIDEQAPIGVVDISRRIRLSHPLIVRMAKRFEKLGLVRALLDPNDARRRQLVPTEKGRAEANALRAYNARLAAMFDLLFAEVGCDLTAMLDRLDAALTAVPIEKRIA